MILVVIVNELEFVRQACSAMDYVLILIVNIIVFDCPARVSGKGVRQ